MIIHLLHIFHAVFLILLHVPAASLKAAETVQSFLSFTFLHSLFFFFFVYPVSGLEPLTG